MSVLEALLLGIVQGLTEFFPVSSSGHLVLTQAVLGVEVPGILFDVFVHLATLLAVLFVYRAKVWALLRGLGTTGPESSWPYLLKLALATVPAALVGFSFADWFEARFADPVFAATMILVTGGVAWSTRWALGVRRFGFLEVVPLLIAAAISLYAGTLVPLLAVAALEAVLMLVARVTSGKETRVEEPTWGAAALMGTAQAVAIFPGISRSGSTVVTGLWKRVDPVVAAEFSFLMSIPAILGAGMLQIPEAMQTDLAIPFEALVVGFVAAAVSGVFAIRFFVALLKRQNFHIFAYYCWIVAGLYLILG